MNFNLAEKKEENLAKVAQRRFGVTVNNETARPMKFDENIGRTMDFQGP